MIDAAKTIGRHGLPEALRILILYRHVFTIGELIDLAPVHGIREGFEVLRPCPVAAFICCTEESKGIQAE